MQSINQRESISLIQLGPLSSNSILILSSRKSKACFCVQGDQQVHGVDFFETFAPLVQWTTNRLMLILEVLLGLKSKQGDITAAFVHADVEKDENIYVEMPHGFRKQGKVLKLKKTLYGLQQRPRAFWLFLM